MTGNYGHFFVYAPGDQGPAREYGINRFGMEVQRLCSVLDQRCVTECLERAECERAIERATEGERNGNRD